jgi:hypothetical protein
MAHVSRSQGENRRPPGSLAWRQYQVPLISGHIATLGFSLSDPRDKTMARVKREYNATHLGLLVVLDDPDSEEDVVLWFEQATSLTLVSQNGDAMISDEVRTLLPRYFAVFFDDIKDVAPEVSNIKLVVSKTGDKKLH